MKTIKAHLPSTPGTLWLLVKLNDSFFRDESEANLLEAITAYVEDGGLGTWEGQSSGAGEMDVSFEVTNLLSTAAQLDSFLRQHYANLQYRISDEYEIQFERESSDTDGDT